MNRLMFSLVCLSLIGCGNSGTAVWVSTITVKPEACKAEQHTDHVTITCPDSTPVTVYNGVQGVQGIQGAAGSVGATGEQGIAGANGVDAVPVTTVKLCDGVNVYPSVFVEYAVCIQDKLYGVYSANGGFLTYLPEGNYSSNAIGSSCNLTVGANCSVTHQ